MPAPGDDSLLAPLCGRIFSTQLDRSKPLWEIALVDGLSDNRHALIAKTHHAMIDGIAGVDLTAVLFDTAPDTPRTQPERTAWSPSPLPSDAELLASALLERVTVPTELTRSIRAALRRPRQAAAAAGARIGAVSAITAPGGEPVPESPINVQIGSHRRFTWVNSDLDTARQIKNSLGGTVNDVVLATVAGALGSYLRSRGHPTRGLELRAMVPVSMRSDDDRGSSGNDIAVMWATLPVGEADPVRRLRRVTESMAEVKSSGQAVGAKALSQLSGFAPQTIMSQAARLVPRQRFFNLVVTNVPGPQFPLYLLGARLRDIYPMVPIAENQALGIAVISYDGRLDFGLNGDWDALSDIELLGEDLRSALAELTRAAQARTSRKGKIRKSTPKPRSAD